MDTFNLSQDEALNRALPEFRKKKDPEDQAQLDYTSTIDSIIDSTKNRFGVPKVDKLQAEALYGNLENLKEINPEAYKTFVGTQASSKYVFGSSEYDKDNNILKDSVLADLPDGVVVYDIEKAKFVRKQGNKVIEVVSVIDEE